jgi:DNA-binding NarL/FixJ family response regulator
MILELKGRYPDMKIILLKAHEPKDNLPIAHMKMIGISGIIDKRYHSYSKVEQAINTVYNGSSFFDLTQAL